MFLKSQPQCDPRVYWIWAQHAFGAGSYKPYELFRRFSGGLREFCESGPSLWNRMELITEKEATALYSYGLSGAEALLEYCLKMGQKVLTPECEKYPEALRNIFDPPAVLYVKGKLPYTQTQPTIAVVGARKASPASQQAAKAFGCQLASGGATVISGCAVGVDAAVLTGALSVWNGPISVLPVCLDSPYVAENESLRRRILERGGALVSEYATERGVQRGTFQVRNRIISGLSHGVLVIQAASRSGTLITARLAVEQNRDVFVYPGEEDDPAYEGSRLLIRDGARPVTSGEEILEEYSACLSRSTREPENPLLTPEIFSKRKAAAEPLLADPAPGEELSEAAKAVWKVLDAIPVHVSQLEEKTTLPAAQVLAALTELELAGKARSYPGKRYSRA